ncbi:mechanosensitive ion channel family protein [Solitalea koreensis]|uniref:Mechanosensitive ion channel n=1 Tax=Solitalea koreensis TaxID=543615 RepID=A0A521BQZ4_9SPHI|nr:mechanosensitive ion channel domain-containing protein [Solitalea koreensis]SMO49485.1 Mechanosensitive ion channel [Solitalea koreensis]
MEINELLKTEIINTGKLSITIGDILNATVILIAAYISIRVLSALITHSFVRKSKSDGRHISIIKLLKYFIWILAIILTLQSLGIDITFLIASSAALLVGIGLGLQNVFKDFISGITLLFEGTIKVNDIVDVDGMVVQVNEISLRTSKVTTREDNVVIIPNHKFIEDKIVNWTNNMLPTRFKINVGVDYSSDVDLVEKSLIECALSHKDVLNDNNYSPSVRLMDFGSSSIDFQLIFYSYNLFRIEKVKSQIRFEIARTFKEQHIIIPFNQLVIHQTKADNS